MVLEVQNDLFERKIDALTFMLIRAQVWSMSQKAVITRSEGLRAG